MAKNPNSRGAPASSARQPSAPDTGAVYEQGNDGAPERGFRPPPDESLDSISTLEWEQDERIAAILADEENQGARIEVYRKNPDGKWAWVQNYNLEDWSSDKKQDLANLAGGGEYKCRVRRTQGRMGQTFHIVIDKSVKAAGGDDRDPSRDMAASVERLARNGTETMMPLFMQMLQMQQAQSAQMMAQMQKSADTQVALMTAALSRPPQASGMDRVVEVLLAKSLTPQQAGPDLEKVIGALGKLRSLSQSDRGDDDDRGEKKGDLLQTLLTALPAVMKVLASLQPQPVQVDVTPRPRINAPETAAPAMPVATVEPVAPAPIVVEETPPGKDDETRTALAAFLPVIIQQADAGVTAAAVAQALSDQLNDEGFDALIDLIERPDWLAVLADVHEGVMLRSPFFNALRQEMIALAETDDESGEEIEVSHE